LTFDVGKQDILDSLSRHGLKWEVETDEREEATWEIFVPSEPAQPGGILFFSYYDGIIV
jgi:hypothetical protein